MRCNPESADVRALVSEVNRLRSTMLQADQLRKLLSSMGGAHRLVLNGFRSELANEPCVAEFPKLKYKKAVRADRSDWPASLYSELSLTLVAGHIRMTEWQSCRSFFQP